MLDQLLRGILVGRSWGEETNRIDGVEMGGAQDCRKGKFFVFDRAMMGETKEISKLAARLAYERNTKHDASMKWGRSTCELNGIVAAVFERRSSC